MTRFDVPNGFTQDCVALCIEYGTERRVKGPALNQHRGRHREVGQARAWGDEGYLAAERAEERANAPVFTGRGGVPMTRDALRRLLHDLGDRSGVPDCHPHRFRHTFAVTFLRNGANIYALQMSLGHTTLDMVQRYLMLTQADLEAAHKQASPVENWRL